MRLAPESRVLIETRGLRKVYGARPALDGVDLKVRAGSVFGLVGPNGSGKTTMLSVLAGLRRATHGSVTMRVDRPRMALLPDTPEFEPWLTAREVVDLARHLVAPEIPVARVAAAIEDAGIGEAIDRRCGGFSRGMLQRLGVAATLVGDPDLMLMDEPCSALDPAGRREVLDLISQQRGRRTVVFSSHILADVQEVCDTVGVLRDGHLIYQGPLEQLLIGHATPTYYVRLRGGDGDVRAVLEHEAWVTDVEAIAPGELRLHVTSLDEAERHIAEALARTQASVISFRPEEASLEHAFLELTS